MWYRNRKRPDGSYVVHLGGEDLIITKAMIDETDPQIMREYLRMLWAQEYRERREYRCRNVNEGCCQQQRDQCEWHQSAKPLSLEALIDSGVSLMDNFSVEDEIEQQETVAELHTALVALDDLSRGIIEMLYFVELAEREVTAIVGMSQNGVHQRKVKALVGLKKLLQHRDVESIPTA